MHEEPARVDASQSPFYEWLDSAAIRELVHRSLELSAGERLMLIKGLVPGLADVMGLADFDAFLAEVAIKACRFQHESFARRKLEATMHELPNRRVIEPTRRKDYVVHRHRPPGSPLDDPRYPRSLFRLTTLG